MRRNESIRKFSKRRAANGTHWCRRILLMCFVTVVGVVILMEVIFVMKSTTGNGVEHGNDQYLDPDGVADVFSEGYDDDSAYSSEKWQLNENFPKIKVLLQRLDDALSPFMQKYLKSIGHPGSSAEVPRFVWEEPIMNKYLSGCPTQGCTVFDTIDAAKQECQALYEECGGVVSASNTHFELRSRAGNRMDSESHENLYMLNLAQGGNFRKQKTTADEVWDVFSSTLHEALSDPSLHLNDLPRMSPREDDSIFLSIASYRDSSCPYTIKHAFQRASNPDKLFIGLVQQNCANDHCYTGTGWGKTRKWVPSPNDIDCLSNLPPEVHKYKAQIKILRLEERQSYGPFFGRYLNSKMWDGENFYMQIDAHTEFRKGWDQDLIKQMRSTPSYPKSVISNYPLSGNAFNERIWDVDDEESVISRERNTPSALCSAKFENAGKKHHTIRLNSAGRKFEEGVNKSIPQQSCFVAAGFFITHGSLVHKVPFDPFLPFLFMGEEIALSVRMWTSGFDIYGPAEDVLRHEYVRKESPKFWESITMIFANPAIHNDLADLLIPRVQMLLGFEETREPESLALMLESFNVGNERLVDDFVALTGLDFGTLKQSAPGWCIKGKVKL